jgi:hypothetical protein
MMTGDKGTLRALGYVCMVAAWISVTFTLFVISEGGSPGIWWPILAVVFSGATAVFFLKAKRLN